MNLLVLLGRRPGSPDPRNLNLSQADEEEDPVSKNGKKSFNS